MVWFLLIKGEHLQYILYIWVFDSCRLIGLLGLFAYLAYKTYERKG